MKYKLNVKFIKELTSYYPGTIKEFCQDVGISQTAWRGYRKSLKIPVKRLIIICNTLRISTKWFILPDDAPEKTPLCDSPFLRKEDFKAIEFSYNSFKAAFGKHSKCGKSLDQMLSELQITKGLYYLWFDPLKYTLTIDKLLSVCEFFDYDISDFIIDSNGLTKDNPQATPHIPTTMKEMREENSKLQDEIAQLKKEISRLKTKNKQLEKLVDESSYHYPRMAADEFIAAYDSID